VNECKPLPSGNHVRGYGGQEEDQRGRVAAAAAAAARRGDGEARHRIRTVGDRVGTAGLPGLRVPRGAGAGVLCAQVKRWNTQRKREVQSRICRFRFLE